MSLTVKENNRMFLPVPEGSHVARCYALIDLGKQFSKFYNNTQPKIMIGWELSDQRMPDGKPWIHLQRYTASLNEKSALRALLEGWRGHGFSPEELEGFDLRKCLGAVCYLTTKQTLDPKTNQRWSKVTAICQLPPTLICPPPINPPIYFDADDYNESDYLAIPEGLRKCIHLSETTAHPSAHTERPKNSWDTYPLVPEPDVGL